MTDNRKRWQKPEILTTLKLWKVQLKFQRQYGYKTTYRWKIVSANTVSTTATDSRKYRYGGMATKTENNYIGWTLTDSVEIPTPNSRFSVMSSSKEDQPNDLRAKRLYLPFPVVGCCRNCPASASSSWAWSKTQICRWNCHTICHTSRDMSISGFGGHIAISGCRSLSQSLGDTLLGLAMLDNPGLGVGISTLSVVVPVV